MRLIVATILALTALAGCAPTYSDADPTDQAFEAIAEWDATVGVLRPGLTIAIRQSEPTSGEFMLGHSFCQDLKATITLYRGRFGRADFDAEVRHVMLHELVHVHEHCNDSDHVADPHALMYPKITDANLDARVAPADIAFMREAWIR